MALDYDARILAVATTLKHLLAALDRKGVLSRDETDEMLKGVHRELERIPAIQGDQFYDATHVIGWLQGPWPE